MTKGISIYNFVRDGLMYGRVKGRGYIIESISMVDVSDGKDYQTMKRLWLDGKYREYLGKFFDSDAEETVNEAQLRSFLGQRLNVT